MPATSGAPERGSGTSGALAELVPGLRWRRGLPGEERQHEVLRGSWVAAGAGRVPYAGARSY